MRKIVEPWGVEELRKQFGRIAFPEYQREPNLWSRIEKQRLIDSMVRQFDRYFPYWESSDSKGSPNEIVASYSGSARPVNLRSIQ